MPLRAIADKLTAAGAPMSHQGGEEGATGGGAEGGGMSGNINYVVASQQAQAALLKRIADTLADHTARLTRIEATLATMDGCIDDLAQSQQRIEQALSAISARLP
jgi:hypothetical protein